MGEERREALLATKEHLYAQLECSENAVNAEKKDQGAIAARLKQFPKVID